MKGVVKIRTRVCIFVREEQWAANMKPCLIMVKVSAKSILNRKREKKKGGGEEKKRVSGKRKERGKNIYREKKVRESLERMLTVCCPCCPGMDVL